MPTRAEWEKEQTRKSGIKNSSSKFDSGNAREGNIVQGRK